MRFCGAVIISLLLYHNVVFSDGSFLRDRELRTDGQSLAEKFFAELKVEMNKNNLQQVTVVGTSQDQLELTKPLLKSFPYFVGKTADKFCKSTEYGPRCSIIYFLASLDKEYLTKVMNDLRNCNRNIVYFFFEGTVNDSEIELVLKMSETKVTLKEFFLRYSEKSLQAYSIEFQRDCSFRLELKMNWTSKHKWKGLEHWHKLLPDLYGCALPVGAIDYRPWMNLEEDEDGTTRIMGGLDGNLVSTIAQKMKFNPVIQRFDNSNKRSNDTIKSVLSSCADRKTMFGVANIRPTEKIGAKVAMTKSYGDQCIVWCVPRIIRSKRGLIDSEFSWITWILVGLTFFAIFAVENIVRNMRRLKRGNGRKLECFRIILDIVGLTLGNPIIYKPLFMGSKFLLIIYLGYSIVITTAYKSSLASILTVGTDESLIVDIEGIIKANLTTGGNEFTLSILQDQKDENELIPELLKRFVVESNVSKALQQVSEDKNLAYLTGRSGLAYFRKLSRKAGRELSFDILDGCVLSHGTVMVLPNSSHLRVGVDKVIQRLTESGILDHWEENDTNWNQIRSGRAKNLETMNTKEELSKFTLGNLYGIFILYCLSLTFCTLIFLGELIFHKFKSLGRVERSKILKRLKIRRPIQFTLRRSN